MLTPKQIEKVLDNYKKAVEVLNSDGEIFYSNQHNFDVVRAFLVAEGLKPEDWSQFVFSEAILECRKNGHLEKRPAPKTAQEIAREKELRDRAASRQKAEGPSQIVQDIQRVVKEIDDAASRVREKDKILSHYVYRGGVIDHARTKAERLEMAKKTGITLED